MQQYVMYLRKSRYDRDYGEMDVEETLRRHQAVLDEYAQKNNLTVTRVFREVVSGESISQRPKMQELLDLITKDDIAGVLCMDIDRLARGNSIDQGIVSQTFTYTNTKIITPGKIYDPANEYDEEYVEFSLFMSRKEYKIINRRLERGRKQSASEGRFMGGTAPYGYELQKIKGDKGNTLRIVPEEAETVRKIFRLYCDEGKGYYVITKQLNQEAVPTRSGKPWSAAVVRQILHNCVYAGMIRSEYKPVVKTLENGEIKRHRTYNLHGCKMYPGLHEPIVSKDAFDTAVKLGPINNKNKTNSKGTFRNIFAGVLYCSCGRKMVSMHCGHKNEKPASRLRCKCTDPSCTNISSTIAAVETAVLRALEDILNDIKFSPPEPQDPNDSYKKSIKKVSAEIDRLIAQQDSICSMLESGIYSADVFRRRNAVIEDKLSEARERKSRIEIDFAKLQRQVMAHQLIAPKIQRLFETYNTMSPEEKNQMYKQIVSKIEYRKPKETRQLTVTVFLNV